jgi:hypothetical protein
MLDRIARLLVALGVTAGGLTGAQGHAAPTGSTHATAAVEAVIVAVGAAVHEAAGHDAAATGKPELTGLELAVTKANEHAADGLATAIAAKAAGQAKGAAASGADHAPSLPPAATDNPGADHRP